MRRGERGGETTQGKKTVGGSKPSRVCDVMNGLLYDIGGLVFWSRYCCFFVAEGGGGRVALDARLVRQSIFDIRYFVPDQICIWVLLVLNSCTTGPTAARENYGSENIGG